MLDVWICVRHLQFGLECMAIDAVSDEEYGDRQRNAVRHMHVMDEPKENENGGWCYIRIKL
jgi:hypothetical protein